MNLKILMLTILISALNHSFSQTVGILDHNNVKTYADTRGIFFTNTTTNQAGYNVPKASESNTLYGSAFWFGGTDLNSQLHLAAVRYSDDGSDFFTGPIANDYTLASYINMYNTIWTVGETEITQHQSNYNTPGYIIPNSILDWPGNGNTANGEAADLAPYIDANHNNIYDPVNGDYPDIRGNKASFFIINDAAGPHLNSGGANLGIEIHFMIYQYTSNDYLDNSTFINVKVFNRSNNAYSDFTTACFADFDIGRSGDDFIGSAPNKDMIYGYNGDNNDNGPGGGVAYGIDPPASGIKMLNHTMDVAGYYNNAGGITGDPTVAGQYWGYMNGFWGSSGNHFTSGGTGFGGNNNTNYIYPDNPNNPNGWSEITEQNPPGDRRVFMSSNYGTFSPGEIICYDYVVLYSRIGDYLQNVDLLYDLADSVQTFFDDQNYTNCYPGFVSNGKQEIDHSIKIYPNPATSLINIELEGTFDVEIFSLSGQKVLTRQNLNASQPLNFDLSDGIYLIKVNQGDQIHTKKLIIKK